MLKNDKSYTFLLSHSSKNRIYIKRVALRKSYLHLGAVALVLSIGVSAILLGVSGTIKTPVFAKTVDNLPPAAQITAPLAQTTKQPEQIDYSRPQKPAELAFNSGGPEDADGFDEAASLEEQLMAIRKTSDPASLPTMWAHLGKINNEFGFRRNPFGGRTYEFHAGMDIDGERGDIVVSPATGTVVAAGYKGGYGNMIEIDHGNGLTTRYGHLSKIEIESGAVVTRGQMIGQVGSTGRSTGPHLHYELLLNDKAINPRYFLPTEPTDLTKIVKK